MKVLFITHYSDFYGANKSMLNLILDLKARYGVSPIVLCPYKGPLTDELQKFDIPFVINVFYIWETTNAKVTLKDHMKMYYNKFIVSNKVVKTMEATDIDIVHSNSSVFNIGQLIADKLNVPHIWHLREFGKLDYNFRYISSNKYVKKTYSKATKLIAISDAIKDYYKNLSPDGNFIRIYNGLKPNSFKKMSELKQDAIQFVCVGLLCEGKNQLEIIEACSLLIKNNHKNFVINLIGDGDDEYLKTIKKYIDNNNIGEYVKIWGYRSDVEDLLTFMDVGIMSSINEAFGRVTIEYMMAQMPVVGTRAGGTKEIINHGYAGFLYNSGDVKDLYENMRYFLINHQQISIMGKQAKKWADKHFSLESNTNAVYELYCEQLVQK
ncbi:glycosyltransferase family 4 protein [Priestia megaterium]|uniref:glycosyltransferase family 4 protein n=1 Tax=Priestia megaterium TaxID=1404 RepID=UPI00366FB3A6